MAANTGINDGGISRIEVAGTAITHLINCSLNLSEDLMDVTTKGSTAGWKASLPGIKSGTISGEAYFAEDATKSFDDLFVLWEAGTSATILYGSGNTGDEEISGTGYISSLSRTAPNTGDNESYTVEFTLTGAIATAVAS